MGSIYRTTGGQLAPELGICISGFRVACLPDSPRRLCLTPYNTIIFARETCALGLGSITNFSSCQCDSLRSHSRGGSRLSGWCAVAFSLQCGGILLFVQNLLLRGLIYFIANHASCSPTSCLLFKYSTCATPKISQSRISLPFHPTTAVTHPQGANGLVKLQ